LALFEVSGQFLALFVRHFLVMKIDIMHIVHTIRANSLKGEGAKPPV
jgi:hypothetical protein